MKSGIYNLIIRLAKSEEIRVGCLGTFVFHRGFYVYTGSAQNGLEKRINRHLSDKKKFHWHIDYLLSYAKIVKVFKYKGNKVAECELSRLMSRNDCAHVVVNKFGSSDCNCQTHLYYFKRISSIKDLSLHNK